MRRHREVRQPKWWQLYASFPILIGLFLFLSRLPLSEGGQQAAQLGSLGLEFAFVQLWLHWNASALRHMDDDNVDSTVVVYRLLEGQPTEIEDQSPAPAAWPKEIKGVLGDTFEWDYIDAQSAGRDTRDPE